MKKHTLLFCTLLMLIPASYATNYQKGDELYVWAMSGLRMRANAELSSEVISGIPYGEQVEILNTFSFDDSHAAIIANMAGHWVKVSYKETEGFVFDAFLSKLPTPDKVWVQNQEVCQPLDMLWSYAHESLSPVGNLLEYSNGLDNENHDGMEIQQLADGNQIIKHLLYEGLEVELKLNDCRLAEIYNLAEVLGECLNWKEKGKPKKARIGYDSPTYLIYDDQKRPLSIEGSFNIHIRKRIDNAWSLFITLS